MFSAMEPLLNFGHYLLSFIVVISVIVFIHELGHYLIARWCGVRIEVFSIGFGRELFGWNDRHGTRWKFSLLPLGGYVKMFGDAGEASTPDNDNLERMSAEEQRVAFHYKPLPAKAAIVFGGPLFNFLLTIVILAGMYTVYGRPIAEPIVSEVMEGSAAEEAGLQPGDRFVMVGDTDIETFADVQRVITLRPEQALPARIARDGREIALTLTPKLEVRKTIFGDESRIGVLGVRNDAVGHQHMHVGEALPAAVKRTFELCQDTLVALGQMITGQRSVRELGGPIKIANYSGKSAERGLESVLWLMALLSVNLGLINLFPIPMLDGGHLMFYAIEGVRGKPMAQKYQEYGFRVGMVLLLMLMAFTTINDLLQLI